MTRGPRWRAGGTGPADTDAPGAAPVVVVRPFKVRVVAWICAAVILALFVAVAAVLRSSDTGVYFRLADQVAMVVLGAFLSGGILLLTRPRVRADARGIEVRNVAAPRYLPWELVAGVSFPDGASWARLDLPDDEYLPVLAIQAVDGRRAVDAIRRVRALHAAAGARGRP